MERKGNMRRREELEKGKGEMKKERVEGMARIEMKEKTEKEGKRGKEEERKENRKGSKRRKEK